MLNSSEGRPLDRPHERSASAIAPAARAKRRALGEAATNRRDEPRSALSNFGREKNLMITRETGRSVHFDPNVPPLGGCAMERGGRHLSEKRLVGAGEAPEIPEAELPGDLGHCCGARGGLAQGSPCQMHAAQQ